MKKSGSVRPDFARPYLVHVCRDGTISYRTRDQPIFNGVAIPVFSVNTEEQAKDIQLRFGRKQYHEHPQIPGKPWYKLSRLGDGSDPASRPDGLLELSDLSGITDMFRDFYEGPFEDTGEERDDVDFGRG